MNKNISTSGEGVIQNNPGRGDFKDRPEDALNVELALEMVRRTDKLKDNTIELALQLKQAREFMAWSASHVRGLWMDWMEESDKAIRHMTEFRMAFDRESRNVKATGKDVSEFFNSPEYLQAHATLKETVTLLERFGQLKASGTLDAFAEFILKVTCK